MLWVSLQNLRRSSKALQTAIHSLPQSPRSFWPVAGIESSGQTRFSEYAQSIRFVFSTNQIWWEVRESRTSGVRPSQSSRSLPQARRIVVSGDENDSDTIPAALRHVRSAISVARGLTVIGIDHQYLKMKYYPANKFTEKQKRFFLLKRKGKLKKRALSFRNLQHKN